MSADDVTLHAQLNYYARETYWNHVNVLATEHLQTSSVNDAVLQFYYCLALYKEGLKQDCLQEVDRIRDHPDVALGASHLALDVHRSFESPDKEALARWEEAVKTERKKADDTGYYHSAVSLYHLGQIDRARDAADKCLKADEKNGKYQCIRGWIDIEQNLERSTGTYFDDALHNGTAAKPIPDAYLGKASFFQHRHNPGGAFETLTQAAVAYPNFLPVQIEKMKVDNILRLQAVADPGVQLMMATVGGSAEEKWEQSLETAQRCLIINSQCIEAHKHATLHAICFAGQYNEAATMIIEILGILEHIETLNWSLQQEMATLFATTSAGHPSVLTQCKLLAQKAVDVSDSAEVKASLGDILRMSGQVKHSIKVYRAAMESADGVSMKIVTGLVHCHMLEGEIEEAQTQLAFLKEAHAEAQTDIDVKFLEILIGRAKGTDRQTTMNAIEVLVDEHVSRLKELNFGAPYLIRTNAEFMLELADYLFTYAPIEPVKKGEVVDQSLRLIGRILDILLQAIPALIPAMYLMGKVKYLAGEHEAAAKMLDQCISKDQTFSNAHLLLAQIQVEQSNYKQAQNSLEVALSYNFEVRDHPLYHLIKAKIHKRLRDHKTAIQTLETAVNLSIFKAAGKDKGKAGQNTGRTSATALNFTQADKAAVYLELIDCYNATHKTDKASDLMAIATAELEGTKEEQLLTLSNADLALARGDADGALNMLRAIKHDHPSFLIARQKMAQIYLNDKKDKRQFTLCYRELVEKNPTAESFVMLGDAYMSIQDPERAIEMYENAMKRNPRDAALARKTGTAYVKSHNYSKAVMYYEAALKSGGQNFLRHDLAELLLKLKQYEKCEKVLTAGLEATATSTADVHQLIDHVKFLILQSKLYQQTGQTKNAIQTLGHAREQQGRVIKRGFMDLADSVMQQKKTAAEISAQLAEYHQSQREFEKAVNFYRESLDLVENNVKVMHAISYLYLIMGDYDSCHEECMKLLKLNKDDEQANLMLADIMYQQNEIDTALDSAVYHFTQILDKDPCHYEVLARMIELTWRNGEAEKAEKYIKRAEEKNHRHENDAGHNFCVGLYEWYTGDANTALQAFNRARRDYDWGERALYNIIEICLNPENEIIGGEVFDTDRQEEMNSQEMATSTAHRFLNEIRERFQEDYRTHLTLNFIQLSSRSRPKIEKALDEFLEMIGTDEESIDVGAILGSARAYQLLKMNSKAKAQLKRVVSHPWNFEDAQYLEQCWLLLADMYINQGKYDVASEILKTCLQRNQSCLKAYEYSGFIKEKDQKWLEAASNYERAWKLSRERNPVFGYKLAFNYLKAKRLVDAIDICHKVLDQYPDYPKIRKDILDKARANLRM